ncbi:MAG: CsgG/HfaB family protein [Verrucomicrobiota bacterium]
MKKALLLSALFSATAVSSAFALFGFGEDDTESTNEDFGLPPYSGVKHAITVLPPKYTAIFSYPGDLSESISSMLESALFDTNRFIVVDRDRIGDTILEQDLQTDGRSAAASDVAQTGMIRSAKYLADIEITDVEGSTEGQSGGLSIGGFRIGGSGGKAQITTIVKIIDSTTGEIVAKERVTGEAGRKGLNVGYVASSWGADLGGFTKTPIGEAAYDNVVLSTRFLAEEFEDFSLEGAVVTVSGDRIIINRGSNFNIPEGQTFVVREQGELLLDPTTGDVLERIEGDVVSTIKVNKVSDKISYAELVDGVLPKKGDVVVATGS